MKLRTHLVFGLVPLVLALVSSASSQARLIDPANSHLHVRVFKSGLLAGSADNHDVEAPITKGTIDENASRVTFIINSQDMRVLDPQLSPDKRRQVQDRMLGPDVLDSTRFPQIAFESTNVQRSGQDQLLVIGQLSLHGVMRQVTVTVRKGGERYVGTCTLKQKTLESYPLPSRVELKR